MDGQLRSDVLLVEDTFSMARIFQEYLRRGPYNVRHCDTGRTAIKEISRDPPDVVLLDLRLPDIDGLDVLRHIRNNNLATATVVITADGSISTAVEDHMSDEKCNASASRASLEVAFATLCSARARRKSTAIDTAMTTNAHLDVSTICASKPRSRLKASQITTAESRNNSAVSASADTLSILP